MDTLLKSVNLTECLSKVKEEQITKPELFFDIKEEELLKILDIKTEGKKFKLQQKIKEIKERHEKDLAK